MGITASNLGGASLASASKNRRHQSQFPAPTFVLAGTSKELNESQDTLVNDADRKTPMISHDGDDALLYPAHAVERNIMLLPPPDFPEQRKTIKHHH
jgi:hypothetical protein